MSNPKGPSRKALFVVTLVAVTMVGSLAAYVKLTPADKVPAAEHRDTIAQRNEPKIDIKSHRVGSEASEVLVFAPKANGDSVSFESSKVAVPVGEDPHVFAVNEFLRISQIVEPSAKLLSVSVEDGIAKLSFNAAFEGGYGSGDEQVLIEGLTRSLGQFNDVTKFEILVDGKPLDSLGSVELAGGLDVRRPE